jgi:DNA-binding Xre family transcriptional regulator
MDEKSCEKTAICTKCGVSDPNVYRTLRAHLANRQIEHQWSEWITIETCFEERVCSRCNATEPRVTHTWSKWDYQSGDDCVQIRKCSKCLKVEDRIAHTSSVWSYVEKEEGNNFTTNEYCSRCFRPSYKRTLSTVEKIIDISQIALKKNIANSFSVEDLAKLCESLDIDPEDIFSVNAKKSEKIRDLIGYFSRRGLMGKLVEQCCRMRPNAGQNTVEESAEFDSSNADGKSADAQIK